MLLVKKTDQSGEIRNHRKESYIVLKPELTLPPTDQFMMGMGKDSILEVGKNHLAVPYSCFVIGSVVQPYTFNQALLESYRNWAENQQNPQLGVWRFFTDETAKDSAEEQLEKAIRGIVAGQRYAWMIVKRDQVTFEGDRVIVTGNEVDGVVSALDLIRKHNRATIGFLAINPKLQKKGLAAAAVHAVCEWLFTHGITTILADIPEGNIASRRCAEHLGFRMSGTRRDFMWVNPFKVQRVELYQLNANEFQQLKDAPCWKRRLIIFRNKVQNELMRRIAP